MMKPIHKFNNGNGATLCDQCSVIITTNLTNDLYCNKCSKELLQDIMKDDEALGLYDCSKQETLEEVAEKVSRAFDNDNYKALMDLVKEGANWQAERMYSEEEVRNIVEQTIEKFYKHRYVETKSEMKELWFEQFKKK